MIMNALTENMKSICLEQCWQRTDYDGLTYVWLMTGFLRHGKVYHPV